MTRYRANKSVNDDGIHFDSDLERRRYEELELLQRGGLIQHLRRAPTFTLQPKFKARGKTYQAIEFTPDFCYVENGDVVIEEVKSKATAKARDYTLRKRLFMYQHPELIFRETIT